MKNKDIEELKQAFDDIIWMAIRYANNRTTSAPGMVRNACKIRAKFGDFYLKEDITLQSPNNHPIFIKEDNLIDLFEIYKKDEKNKNKS